MYEKKMKNMKELNKRGMIAWLALLMMTSVFAGSVKGVKNVNNRAKNGAALNHGKKMKKSIGKEKIMETKKVIPEVAMSFSKEELFDGSDHEMTNAYVRIYQAIGEVMRMSHQYNIIDVENQKGLNYVAHILGHIAQQSNNQFAYKTGDAFTTHC